MTSNNNISTLLCNMQRQVSLYEKNRDSAILDTISSDFQHFAQLVTLFLISERDTYYGYFFMSMSFRTNFASSSIAGIRLDEYPPVFETNPLLLLKFNMNEILYIFCHEVDHVLFNHPAEMVKSNPSKDPSIYELFNYAADAAVNDLINQEIQNGRTYLSMPKGAITSHSLADMFGLNNVLPLQNYLYYLNLLIENECTPPRQQNGIAPLSQDGTGAFGSVPSMGTPDDSTTVTAQDVSSLEDHSWSNSVSSHLDSDASQKYEAAAKQLINSAVSMASAETRGLMPNRFKQQIAKINEPARLNWKQLLKRYVGTVQSGKTKTKMRLNRRQPKRFDLSGTKTDTVIKIVVAIDTSASMSADDISAALNEVTSIVSKRKHQITVIECDSQIQRTYEIRTPSDIKPNVQGRGGTAFTPVIEFLNNNAQFRDALLIYFTDGFGEMAIPKPCVNRILWVIVGDAQNLSVEQPYGIAVNLDEG